MADAKSVLAVDVDTSQFDRFTALFAQYKEQLAKMPEAWMAVGRAMEQAHSAVPQMGSGAAVLAEQLDRATHSQQRFHTVAQSSARVMGTLSRTAKEFSNSVVTAAKMFAGFGLGLTGFSAMGIGAPLWLFDRLGKVAYQGQKSATGMGVTYGERKAFENVYGPVLGNPDQFLQGISEKQLDLGMQARLSQAANVPVGQVQGMDPAQLTQRILEHYKELFGNRVPTLTELGAQGFEAAGISPEEARRLSAMTPEQVRGLGPQFEQRTQQLDVQRGTLEAWTRLKQTLDVAGEKITSVLITGLVKLTDPLTKLSAAFSDAVKTFLEAPAIRQWIDAAAAGLEAFAKYVGTPAFTADVQNFAKAVGEIASDLFDLGKAIVAAVKWIAHPFTSDKGYDPKDYPNLWMLQPGWKTPDFLSPPEAGTQTSPSGRDPVTQYYLNELKQWWSTHMPPGLGGEAQGGLQKQSYLTPGGFDVASIIRAALGISSAQAGTVQGWQQFGGGTGGPVEATRWNKLEQQFGLPAGLLASVENTESRGNINARSPAGALGAFQFMPATANAYGINPFDEADAARGAGMYLQHLLQEFGGNTAAAVAAYNAGEGRVQQAMRQYGSDWQSHLPTETQAYVPRVLGGGAGTQMAGTRPNVVIRIENNTGGSATVAANQLAI